MKEHTAKIRKKACYLNKDYMIKLPKSKCEQKGKIYGGTFIYLRSIEEADGCEEQTDIIS